MSRHNDCDYDSVDFKKVEYGKPYYFVEQEYGYINTYDTFEQDIESVIGQIY